MRKTFLSALLAVLLFSSPVFAAYKEKPNVSNVTGTLPVANGGTGAVDQTNARSNLGLGSMATQNANSVAITGGNLIVTTATATTFRGALVGDVTGNVSGTSGSTTGNAGTATTLQTTRAISIGGSTGLTAAGQNFNGSAAITLPLTGTLAAANGGTGLTSFTRTGNSTLFATSTGALTANNCIKSDANGNFVDAGAACGAGSGSGTVNSGNAGLLAYYSATGTAVSMVDGPVIYADALGVLANASDQTTNLINAISLATSQGRCLQLPKGTILATTGTNGGLLTNSCILGQPSFGTTLKMPNGANKSVLKTVNADTLWGTATTSGSHNVVLRDLVIDGNRTNNTSGDCVDLYGAAPNWENVYAKECPTYMFRTEWGDGDGPGGTVFGMEGNFRHIRGDTSGQHGWRFAGPHDSHMQDVILIDAGMTTTNTYDGVYVEKYGINADQMHIWRRDGAHEMRYSFNDATSDGPGSSLSNSFFEGAQTAPMYLNQGNWVGASTVIYPASSGNNIPGVILGYNLNTIDGARINCSGSASQVGVQIGTSGGNSSANKINATARGCHGGFVNFTYNDGGNNITMDGYDNGSWPSPFTGVPDSSDTVQFTGNYKRYSNINPKPKMNSATQSITSSTTLTNATGLSETLLSGKSYSFEIHLPHTANVASGFKAAPSGGTVTATNVWYCGINKVSGGTAPPSTCVNGGTSRATAVCATTADALGECVITGGIKVNAGGTFIPQFAQNVSGGTATVLQYPAWMRITPLD